jgi:hypothetical protein
VHDSRLEHFFHGKLGDFLSLEPGTADFINKCLARKASSRLGYNGNPEVKNHHWFKDFDWEGLTNGTIPAPFVPN